MKKIITTSFILFSFLILKAQHTAPIQFFKTFVPNDNLSKTLAGTKNPILKAAGDTLYYQDFSGGLPSGWTIVNNNPNSFPWTWDTVYRNGQFSNASDIITSTTANNGFLSLPSDFYNTPIPFTGPTPMNTYVESDSLIIPPRCATWISYQQKLKYCCNVSDKIVLQVSTDNFMTFTEFDATNGLAIAANSGTINNVINISNALSGDTIFKIRFLSLGSSHYFWMIDDFTVIEGPENDMKLPSATAEFNPSYAYNPYYYQVPVDLTSLSFSGTVLNNGCNASTNSLLNVEVIHDSFPNGNIGLGLLQTLPSATTPILLPDANVFATTTLTNQINASNTGHFKIRLTAISDSIDQYPGNETIVQTFSTSDTSLVRDNNVFDRNFEAGPHLYNQGRTFVGDKFGSKFIIESQTGNGGLTKIPTSISFRVHLDTNSYYNLEITPKIWPLDTNSTIQPSVASSFTPYTILPSSSAIDTFITLSLDVGIATTSGLTNGQYIVGYEVSNTNTNGFLRLLDNVDGASFQPPVSCFLAFGGSTSWGWVDANPGIRLNFGNMPISTSIEEHLDSNQKIGVYPNPGNGEFTVQFNENKKEYQLNVINSIGQSVYSTPISGSTGLKKNLNLKFLNKGLYYLMFQNETERLVEMVVIN